MKKASLVMVSLVAVFLGGCDGGAGVGNGRIQGTVLAPQPGYSGAAAAAGVSVEAVREESPQLIRTATTDVYGHYQMTDVPTGTWDLTFFGNGYQTPSNNPLTLFVEPNGVAQAPNVILAVSASSGSAQVVVNALDAVTGAPIVDATVTVGVVSTSVGVNGSYSLYVPVSPDSSGLPGAQRITVNDAAYLPGTESPSTVTPLAGQTVTVTVSVSPAGAAVQGVVQSSLYNQLYLEHGTFSQVSISSSSIEQSYLNPQVDQATGQFSVRVPGSSNGVARTYDLIFSAPGFYLHTTTGLIAPPAGSTATLSGAVSLTPVTVTLEGSVVNSSGNFPAGPSDQVAIIELGLSVPILNGTFTIAGVPTGIPLTVRATDLNTLRPLQPTETGTVVVTPTENGSGQFALGTIQTR